MRRFIKSAILASALVISQSASAAPPPSGILVGEITVSLHFMTTCYIVFDIDGNSADITLAGGDPLSCDPLVQISSPVSITVSDDKVTFNGLTLWIGSYSCTDDLDADWNGATLTIDSAYMEGDLYDCFIDATASY